MFSRLIPYFLALTIVAMFFFTFTGSHGAIRLTGMGEEIEALEARNKELESQIAELSTKISALQRSEFELERTAREGLGLARPDETVYMFHKQEPEANSERGKETRR